MAITVISGQARTTKYIGASTDTKPTIASHGAAPAPVAGSTFLEYDTRTMYITHDGTNWVAKDVQSLTKEIRTSKVIDGGLGAYAANDVVSNEDCCATTATCWTFENVVRENGGTGEIRAAILVSESEGIVPLLTFFFFNAIPTSNLIDNAPNTAPDCADILKFIGKADFTALESLGTTDSMSIITPSTPGGLPLPFKCAAGDRNIYAILVTRTIFTQSASDDIYAILSVEWD